MLTLGCCSAIDSKFIASPGIEKYFIWSKKCLMHNILTSWNIINSGSVWALLGPMKDLPALIWFVSPWKQFWVSGKLLCTQGCCHQTLVYLVLRVLPKCECSKGRVASRISVHLSKQLIRCPRGPPHISYSSSNVYEGLILPDMI